MRIENDDIYSLVRVLHAVPGIEAVDIYLNGSLFFAGLRFTEFTPYVYVPEGVYEISIYSVDTTENPLIKRNIEIDDDELVTIAIAGRQGELRLISIDEEIEQTAPNTSKVRVANLAPNVPKMNVLSDGNMLFSDLEFLEVTDYIQIQPELYRVDLEEPINNTLIRSNRIRINPNRIYTLYILGSVPNVQIFQSLDGITFMRKSRIRR